MYAFKGRGYIEEVVKDIRIEIEIVAIEITE